MKKTFAAFLETKSISNEAFNELDAEKSAALYAEYLSEVAKAMDEAIKNGATKEELKEMQDAQAKAFAERSNKMENILKEQGKAIKSLLFD